MIKNISEVGDLKGVKALMCVDFNVPIKNGIVLEDFRLRKVAPTIEFLREKGAKTILIGHVETPKDHPTLAPVVEHLKKLGISVEFVKNYRNAREKIEKMNDGDIVVLENIREHKEEIENDKGFAKELASLADIYINEAFSVSHRNHVSVSAITEFLPSYAGMLFQKEINYLSTAFNPDHPFLFILCGIKFETKLPLLEKFIGIADNVFVGGALANDFLKEKGKEVGKSIVSEKNFNLGRFSNNPKLLLPVDVVVFGKDTMIKDVNNIAREDAVYDAGPKTMNVLDKAISNAKYILWNGPLGAYEQGFTEPTKELAFLIASATARGARSILGGGDTLAALSDLKLEKEFTFVSTGGGAMLEYLAKGTLPGIQALENGMKE